MTLKGQMAADAAIFFNTDECGDPITYICNNISHSIVAVADIGMSNQKGNEIVMREGEGSAARASFEVSAVDIPDPEPEDLIIHKGKTWRVVRMLSTDGIIHNLMAIADESPFPVRWG